MSIYFPPYNNSSDNIKVELDLSNYATKTDLKNVTHVDVSSYALKTNLAALKTEVDKIDTDKLKTVPDDLAKLRNVVKNDTVKKTEFTPLKNKVDGIDTNNFVSRTKFEKDIKDLDDTIDQVGKRIPDVSGLATKSSITSLLSTTTFNSTITEIENKIKTVDGKVPSITGLATKTELTAVENKIPDTSSLVKKSDYATEITSMKNDYVNNASLDSKLNDLKAQHIADKVKKVDDKTKKNASDILGFESRLKKKILLMRDKEKIVLPGDFIIICKKAIKNTSSKLTTWKSTGIDNLSANYDSKAISDGTLLLPTLENYGRMSVKFNGNYFVQNKVLHPNNNNVINIYVAYKLDAIDNTRNTDYAIQNALFGAVKITKSSDISKNKYEGYGICFDEVGTFTKGNITNGKNVIIFGADMSFSIHAINRANNIYVLGDFLVQGINGTSIYAEKIYSKNFTEPGNTFVLSLHYNSSNSYLFVNGTQELKFKAKNDQILKEKLCVRNLSSG